ncbi:MAG TPA: hypothetical protein VGB53_09480 [Rubricoccaceae bacterium]
MSKARMDQNWDRMKDQIVAQWGGIDEGALKKARGNLSKVVDLIAEHTGEARATIMTKMSAFI